MEPLCNLYIRRAGWFGVVFCVIPTLTWFVAMLLSVPFREVYLLRLGLCLVSGSAITAYLNKYGVETWLTKHRSVSGPATIIDGALIGAAVGLGSALLPVLSAFIKTNHPEMAKTFVIVSYLSVTLVGAIIGASLAAIGRKYVDRSSTCDG